MVTKMSNGIWVANKPSISARQMVLEKILHLYCESSMINIASQHSNYSHRVIPLLRPNLCNVIKQ